MSTTLFAVDTPAMSSCSTSCHWPAGACGRSQRWLDLHEPGRPRDRQINDADLADFIDRQKTFADSPKSWSVDVKDIDPKTCDL